MALATAEAIRAATPLTTASVAELKRVQWPLLPQDVVVQNNGEWLVDLDEGYMVLGSVLFDQQTIHGGIKGLAETLVNKHASHDNLHFVTMLKGAKVFATDLRKEMLEMDPSLKERAVFDTMRVRSYVGTESTGNIQLLKKPKPLFGKRVVLLEDIVDGGGTLAWARTYVEGQQAESYEAVALLERENGLKVPREKLGNVIVGLTIAGKAYVVGYGIDKDGRYRKIPEIYGICPETECKLSSLAMKGAVLL